MLYPILRSCARGVALRGVVLVRPRACKSCSPLHSVLKYDCITQFMTVHGGAHR